MARRAASALLAALTALSIAAGGAATGAARPRVALILDSVWRDSPIEKSAYSGFRRAVRQLGVDGELVVEGPREPLKPVLLSTARRRFDLIIATPFLEPAVFVAVAREFPRQRFLALDTPVEALPHPPSNVGGTVFAVEQPSYLAGYLAASMEARRPGKDVVSSVGGLKIPQVDRFVAGFQAGARAADPGVSALNGYSNNFVDTEKCRRLALAQIAKGSGVVFQVAGICGYGALAAAKEQGVFGVGVDADQSGLGPHVLTSVVKRLDVAVYREVRSYVRGTFPTARTDVFTLANGGVGLGRLSPRVPRALVARVQAVQRRIASGEIRAIPTTVP